MIVGWGYEAAPKLRHARGLRLRPWQLLLGTSVATIALTGSATPARAQLLGLRAAAGALTPPIATATTPTAVRPASMREAIARTQALQTRADQLKAYVTSARNAALAATRTVPTDGLSANGLDPIAPVRQAALLIAKGDDASKAQAAALLAGVSADKDASGVATWEGASAPVQTTANGRTVVTITQSQARALLSWNRFDVGANTDLTFSQKSAGVAQPGWTVVNRVVNSIAPSTILGHVTADGTVLVLNQRGVVFGAGAQVNLHSLLVSSLDLGNFAKNLGGGASNPTFDATTIKDRNTSFLQNGLFLTPTTSTQPQLLLSALYAPGTYAQGSPPPLMVEGSVEIDPGATITSGEGGFVIAAAPSVTNAGVLDATDGQVSLQGGRFIGVTQSTGAAGSADPNVRGLILSSVDSRLPSTPPQAPATPEQGIVTNSGLIRSRRGYLSLGTSFDGQVTNSGLLLATTGVSRNGKIAITAGTVTLAGDDDPALASGIEIDPDADGETIPQGTAADPPTFKTSQIVIRDRAQDFIGDDQVFSGSVTMGKNAFILAPSANVIIGREGDTNPGGSGFTGPVSIDIQSGATIDVSGVKAVALDASANSVTIKPVKRNELRDTPNYREVTTDGAFTLNGTSLTVDVRRSGVRADGVAWVGSPLIEAGSLVSEIPVTAAELMTKGGNVSLGVSLVSGAVDPALASSIRIAKDAVIDLSGGWVTYAAGFVRSSQLFTADGRVVDIGDADPNDVFVGVSDGFTAAQPRFGISNTFSSPLLEGGSYSPSYDEGRDAGTLKVSASSIGFDGTIHGDAFAGANQIAEGRQASFASTIASDPRRVQASAQELPAGAFVKIGSFTGNVANLGGDITVFSGTRGDAAANPAETVLDAGMLSAAKLSALTLQTSGAVTFAGADDATLQPADALTLTGAAALTLAAGGVLTVDAGRTIRFDGDIAIAGGTIRARTFELGFANDAATAAAIGSPFRADDDIAAFYAPGTVLPRPYDIVVNGDLSVAGRWANDYLNTAQPIGRAYRNGGTISLTVAPKVLVPQGDGAAAATGVVDLSGSLRVARSALLDVSAGGYVAADGTLTLDAKGGTVRLIDETTYAATTLTAQPVIGDTQSYTGQTVAFTPVLATDTTPGVTPSLVPATPVSTVDVSIDSIKGFGFAGGGTLQLVAPTITFDDAADPLTIPLDVFARTGFSTLDLTAYHTRILPTLFSNGSTAPSAFFATTALSVGAGKTLDLTQSVLPSELDPAQVGSLLTLASGSRLASVLTPYVPPATYDRLAANLQLHGLVELDVEQGGAIVGAPEARIVTPKLHNAGSIVLPGGTIEQQATLPIALNASGLGVTDLSQVLGARDANGLFDENAANAAGIADATTGATLTNGQLFSTIGNEHFVYFVGEVGTAQGVLLDPGSVVDLSGVALYDPRAPYRPDGTQYRFGRVVAGGSLVADAAFDTSASDQTRTLFSIPQFGDVRNVDNSQNAFIPPSVVVQTAPRTIVAGPGATIRIAGASGAYDEAVTATTYASAQAWSDAGRLALDSGGSLGGATIDAHGGAAQASGGTLEWLTPTLRQSVDATAAPAADAAYADAIEAAGFQTLIAYGGLTLAGDVSLSLARSLLVTSAPSLDGSRIGPNAAVTIDASTGATATISAPYIHFSSRSGTVQAPTGAIGDATVTFAAGDAGMDFSGGILFGAGIRTLGLTSVGDIRLSGVDDRADTSTLPVLNGTLTASGEIDFDAARVYTTTGTGNLQRILEDEKAGISTANLNPYRLTALNDSAIRFGGSHIATDTPLSAGSYLQLNAGAVEQDGYLAAPLGRMEFGTLQAPIASVTLGAGSVTSVSGLGATTPYGTTTDLTEYYFTPGSPSPVTTLPSGDLRVTGSTITVNAGATVDGRGGGAVYAYEFVSGTGGSRDVLSRFNTDAFSSNDYDPASGIGYQFPDERQVYAIVPAAEASRIAPYDPIYSADYGASGPADLYGTSAGLAVTLDGGAGIPAGQYLLLPAHYALLPNAYRVVENVGAAAPAPGTSQTLLDGSIVLGGTYSTAGTGLIQSQRRSFTVESQATFLKYSDIQTTDGSTTIKKQAASAGVAPPRLPVDAARLILDPLNALTIAGTVQTAPANGGRGAQVDILASSVLISHAADEPADGSLLLTDATLTNLNANSLVIGAQRFDNSDDTTRLGITATTIDVANGVTLAVPELVLAVAGQRSKLTVEDGATLAATGTLADPRGGDYVITSTADPAFNDPFDESGVGSILRLANGAERGVNREGDFAARNTLQPSTLRLGAATLSGATLTLDTSRRFAVSGGVTLAAPSVILSSDALQFGGATGDAMRGFGGIGSDFEAKLAMVDRLTLRSPDVIGFAAGPHSFKGLAIDSPGLAQILTSGGSQTVTINAGDVRIANSHDDAGACKATGVRACTATGNALIVNAQTLTLGSGTFRTYGFDGAVAITAARGSYYTGAGSLNVAGAALTLTTPFLVDRASVLDPASPSLVASDQITPAGTFTIPVTPDYQIATTGTVTIAAPAGAATAAPAGLRAPGATLAIGSEAAPVTSIAVAGTAITATAGVIDMRATGDIALSGAAALATPGYARSFGDAQDTVTISAGGGTVNLVSLKGGIRAPSGTTLTVDDGIGAAGTLNLIASEGAIDFGASLDPTATGNRTASLAFDAGLSRFDFDGFVAAYGTRFGGDIAIRSGVGDLTLAAGRSLKATSVSLDADGGSVSIAGTIDTSGQSLTGLSTDAARTASVNGGDIALWGETGVTLASGATLDTHTDGYADADTRQASAGNVTLGIGLGGGAITIASGATIDVSATRTQSARAAGDTGNRLVPVTVTDPATLSRTTAYHLVLADTGGAVTLRAPVGGSDGETVDVRLGGAITGAASQTIEGYRRYDLDQIAASGLYSGVTATKTGVSLDLFANAARTGRANILAEDFVGADGTPSLVHFIRTFAPVAKDGESLAGFTLQPGVDLTAARTIAFTSDWNLGAGIVDQQRAAADGLLVAIPELGNRPDGTPYYAVASGREGDLLADYTSFLYRVGGKASGEAAAVTLRAGSNLTIGHSITDGFFTFADKSDPAYINYQLGGGDRTYALALPLICAGTTADCAGIPVYSATSTDPSTSVSIGLNLITRGSQSGATTIVAPYDPLANSAAAARTGTNPNVRASGSPLDYAQLFPLLPDGSAIHSSTLRLVGGAGRGVSADPTHVDRGSGGRVSVTGETSYALTAKAGQATFGDSLDLKLREAGDANPPTFALDQLIDTATSDLNVDQLTADSYTTITYGAGLSGAAADERAAAEAYFAGTDARFDTIGGRSYRVSARLGDVIGFLQSFSPTFVSHAQAGDAGYPKLPTLKTSVISFGDQRAYTKTMVRTGDGSIAIASGGDVDLRGTPRPIYRTQNGTSSRVQGPNNAQIGGTAVYTAGVRVSPAAISARVIGGGATLSVAPGSPYLAIAAALDSFLPSPKQLNDQGAVLATGGGGVSIEAGGDVLGRRDVYAETFLGTGTAYRGTATTFDADQIGDASDRWRVGTVGQDTEIAIAPRYFTSGVGALGGGNVRIRSGGNVGDLTVALDDGVTTTDTTAGKVQITYGSGTLDARIGGDLLAGQIDVAHGAGTIAVAGQVAPFGIELTALRARGGGGSDDVAQYLRVRVADATVGLTAGGPVALASVSALGAKSHPLDQTAVFDSDGFFSPSAGFSVTTPASLRLAANRSSQTVALSIANTIDTPGLVLPPSLSLVSLTSTLQTPALTPELYLYPSSQGQLTLASAGSIDNLVLAMGDSDPTLLPGDLSAFQATVNAGGNAAAQVGILFGVPGELPTTDDATRRLYHDQAITHLGDDTPVRIYAGADITDSIITLPKQARISAGRDIQNLYFVGQNLASTDETRITAGRDIIGTTSASATTNLPYVVSSNYELGGPGTFSVEAGRNIGPFINSATVNNVSYAGGIRTVGNDDNPWLGSQGADLSLLFGVANGIDYAGLRDTYLDPTRFAQLDGDLFVQVSDTFGNLHPDRTRQIYAPILAAWLRDNDTAGFTSIFGAQPITDAALPDLAYANSAKLYDALLALPTLEQDKFLVKDVYFNELKQPALLTSPSYEQYIRGNRAVQALFPKGLGYTDNLAPYTTDPKTVSADHPLGEPVRNIVNGQPEVATRVQTGNADLRLATVETARGGDVTILGPGGDFIAGSVVRTSEQAARRVTRFNDNPSQSLAFGVLSGLTLPIDTIPLGFEGVLTLRGGAIDGFTDGDFRVNQSRVFTQAGGDITLWSSNGDLNAGQGPKTAASFPPVTVRFDQDALAEVDSAGSVAGGGIGTFKRDPSDPSSTIILVAPVGLVDAGDAGVRASGDIFVAAARIANADSFSAGGTISGVPSLAATPVTVAPTAAASALVSQLNQLSSSATGDRRSVITVDVLSGSDDPCADRKTTDTPCKLKAGSTS